ncbi:C6 zinc finger protein [Cadophora sp. MPI-SDFR-AT-0126]|nr:C6 zinc finger protein [Leotiomycetes sp. MPI-SDFR-AT-0126]
MVFTGRMSRGCESCRKLHTKCDEKRPSCSRCLRTNRQCTGYRDTSEFIFRHIVPNSSKKNVRSGSTGGAVFHINIDLGKSHDHFEKERCNLPRSPGRTLLPSKEDQRLCFFYQTIMENLVDSDHTRYLHGQLPTLFSRSRSGSALHLATQAISYATWKRSCSHDCGVDLAVAKRYAQALAALGEAVRDPVESRSDETLYAVLLLSGYETITFNSEALSAWGTHVDGAAALVKNRGGKNFSTPFACMMFLFVRRSAIQSHLQTSIPVDPMFEECSEFLSPYENIEDRLLSKTMRIPKLQARANILLSPASWELEEDLITELLQSADDLDHDLANWALRTPTQWSYSTITRIGNLETSFKHSAVYVPDQIHRYPDLYVARIWNLYRVSRLIIQSMILRISCLSATTTIDFQDRIDTINKSMVSQICASVPFLLGYDCSELKHGTDPPPTSLWPQCLMNKPRESNNTGKFSLIWPMYVASSVESAPEVQRDWLREQLSWIAGTGELHAQVLRNCTSQTLAGRPETFRFDCV